MPRISSELNKRSRKFLRPRELPTWWNLFSGALIAVVLAYMLWNLIADRGGVAAPVTAPDTTSVVVQTIPTDGTASPSSSVPGVTPVVTQPVTNTPGDLVDVPTYAGSSVSVPRGAVLAAEAFVDTGVWLFDVRVDLDGAGAVAPGVVIVQVDVAVGGTYAASRAG